MTHTPEFGSQKQKDKGPSASAMDRAAKPDQAKHRSRGDGPGFKSNVSRGHKLAGKNPNPL